MTIGQPNEAREEAITSMGRYFAQNTEDKAPGCLGANQACTRLGWMPVRGESAAPLSTARELRASIVLQTVEQLTDRQPVSAAGCLRRTLERKHPSPERSIPVRPGCLGNGRVVGLAQCQ